MVSTGIPSLVLGESCTTSIKDFAIFSPNKKKKSREYTFLYGACPRFETINFELLVYADL